MARIRRPTDALEWIAAMGTHLPLRGEQMVRYYGEFSNCIRGRRRKAQQPEAIPTVLEPEISTAQARKHWARLLQKVYEADLSAVLGTGRPLALFTLSGTTQGHKLH
jgi:hypothetical protein